MTTAANRNSLPATAPASTVPFTSESVTEGHPDISDAILDEALRQEDPLSRVACETLLTTGLVVIAGEITTTAVLDYTGIARRVVRSSRIRNSRFEGTVGLRPVAGPFRVTPDALRTVHREARATTGVRAPSC